MSYAHYQQAQPGWGTPQVLSLLSTLISHLVILTSINLVLLLPQLFNHNLLVSFSPYLPTIRRSSFKQGEAWISIVLMQEVMISIRKHRSLLRHKSSTPTILHRSLFDNAWNRVRGYSESMTGGIGVGTHEAKHWHRRAYGGIVSFPSRFHL
jgi:hypothetical protein